MSVDLEMNTFYLKGNAFIMFPRKVQFSKQNHQYGIEGVSY